MTHKGALSVAILYDGLCGLCRGTCGILRRLDWLARLEFVDLHDRSVMDRRFPGCSSAMCLRELLAVFPGGRITSGFEAVRSLLWLLPLAIPVAPLLYIPGVPSIGRRSYRWVAARRHRHGPQVD